MTKEQVYAARNMYLTFIKNNATRVGVDSNDYCSVLVLVANIMKKTSSKSIIEETLKYYSHYVQMQQRIDLQIWEEEE